MSYFYFIVNTRPKAVSLPNYMSHKKTIRSNLQGIASLVTDATIGITDLVEAMHRQIVHPPFLPSTPIQHLISGLAGITYKNIRWSTKLIGNNIGNVLGRLTAAHPKIKNTYKTDAIRSVLNGVIGDYLERNENPLAITMQIRHEAEAISIDKKSIGKAYPTINGKILLMVHGACMNDIKWTQKKHNHGLALAKELKKTPVYLNYNSGLHISTNGQNFSALIEELIQNWPLPVEELVIIGHSMGGLVSRSALYYGQQQQKLWTKHLKKIVFLGTPHHGAPLEKIGNFLDAVLEAIPYTKPFAKLGKIRSAGVTDLRYGNLLDEDWKNIDRFKRQADKRQHLPLPQKVACYSIAGIVGKKTSVAAQLLGDNMVNVKSALGAHKDYTKTLNFKQENTMIAYENNHIGLLSDATIYNKLKCWLV